MDTSELMAVLERYPEFLAGLPDHVDELVRIAERIVATENEPVVVPALPDDAPDWERAYWARRAART